MGLSKGGVTTEKASFIANVRYFKRRQHVWMDAAMRDKLSELNSCGATSRDKFHYDDDGTRLQIIGPPGNWIFSFRHTFSGFFPPLRAADRRRLVCHDNKLAARKWMICAFRCCYCCRKRLRSHDFRLAGAKAKMLLTIAFGVKKCKFCQSGILRLLKKCVSTDNVKYLFIFF